MKFIISSKALLHRLLLLKNAVKHSNVLPILETVLFVVQKKQILLHTSDLKQTISLRLDCEANSKFSFCVYFTQIFNLVNNCMEQPITFWFDEKERSLKIIGFDFEVTLPTERPEDYPKLPEVAPADLNKLIVTGKQKDDLFLYLKRALPFISRDDLRPAINGVYLHSKDNKLHIASTDAHRLYFKATDIAYAGTPMIVEGSAVRSLLLMFAKSDEVIFNSDKNNLHVIDSFKYTELFTRLIDAKYPDYAVALEPALKGLTGNVSMISKDMKRTIKLCTNFSNPYTNQLVFEIDHLHIKYKVEDVDLLTSATATCPVYDADIKESLTIAFNGKILLEILNLFKDEYVKLGLPASPTKAMFVNDCVLIMPLMLNN